MGLLGEIVDILNENWKDKDSSKIFSILHNLAGVQRFSLSLQFLSCVEKEVLVELFQKLNKVVVAGEDGEIDKDCLHMDHLRTLERIYEIQVE